MKRYWPIIVAAVAPALAVVVMYISAPASEGARAKLERDIDQELAKARRLLAAYEPTQHMLLAGERRLSGKGGSFEATDDRLQKISAKWDKATSYAEQESPIKPTSADLQRALGEASNLYRERVGGAEKEPSVPMAADASGARRTTTEWLEVNETRLKDAIQIIDAVMTLSASSGEESFSGREDVEANRLRAILAYHYAESLRQEALLERSRAERLSERLLALYGEWIGVATDVAVAERALEGSAKSMPVFGATASPSAAASAPATAKAATAAQRAPAAATRAATAPAKRGKLLSKVFDAISGRKKAVDGQPAKAAAQPAAEGQAAGQGEPAPPQAVELEPVRPIEPLRDRIADLDRQRVETTGRIAKLQGQIKELKTARDSLDGQIQAKRAEAAAAEKKMAESENRGFDPKQPGTLKQQTAEYEALSKAAREASREAAVLQSGGYTNATLVTDSEDWHTARIASAKAGEQLTAQKSLRQYDQEIGTATASLQGQQKAVDVLEKRIQTLRTLQTYFEVRLAGGAMPAATQPAATQMVVPGLRKRHEEIINEAKTLVSLLQVAANAADTSDEEAIAELGRGINAAKQAKQSLGKRQSDARSGQPSGGEPNPRLQRIEQEGWRGGDADAMLADLELLQATIYYQRAMARGRVADVLDAANRMGIAANAAAVRTAADADKPKALAAADVAKDAYVAAEPELKKDWTVHMNLAAAYYLLAHLTQGPQAAQHLENARKEYLAGVSGPDEKNPDRRPYADRLDAIQKALAKPKRP